GGGGGGGGDRGGNGGGNGGGAATMEPQVPLVLTPVGDTQGWFDPSRDGGFIRRAQNSYLAEQGDAWVTPAIARQWNIKKGDHVQALIGKDPRNRVAVMEVQ